MKCWYKRVNQTVHREGFTLFLFKVHVLFGRARDKRHNPKNYNTYVMINLLLVDVGQAGKAWAPPPCPTSTSYKFNVDISNSRKKGVLAGLCPSSSPSLNYFMSTLIQGSAGTRSGGILFLVNCSSRARTTNGPGPGT